MSTTSVRTSIPLQIWIAVVLLALEGTGNLVSSLNIYHQYSNLTWLGAKVILVAGLLLRWRTVYVTAVVLAGFHVVFFASVSPLVAVLNLLLVVLVGSAFRFYFPAGEPRDPARAASGSTASRPVRYVIAVMTLMFGLGLFAAIGVRIQKRQITAVVVDSVTGTPVQGAHSVVWNPTRESGNLISFTPRTDADGRLRIFIPRKHITPDFNATFEVHAIGYESGEWNFSELQSLLAQGRLDLKLKRDDSGQNTKQPGKGKTTLSIARSAQK